jgi:hypothetical protein
MIFGLSTFGFVHTAASLLAIVLGLFVVASLLTARPQDGLTAVYFASAAMSDATGFGFPRAFDVVHVLGLVLAFALLLAFIARYIFRLSGVWRPVFAVATVASVHAMAFFTVGEAFLRIPALHALAPTLTERPFAITQLVVFVLFVLLAIAAAVRFKPDRAAAR